jgi:hypothetical protein
MREQYKAMFPCWVDFVEEDYDLVLSNDVDSLLSCLWLNKMFGWRINYFYDFTALYQIRESKNDKIYVDIDVVSGKGWGNHVTLLHKNSICNTQTANLNTIFRINRENYCKKYAGSTLLTILSYYDYPAFLLPKEAQKIILAIDGTYKGFYDSYFRKWNYFYIHNVLDVDYLYNLQREYTIDDFYATIGQYNLHKKVFMRNGMLDTKIKLAELCELFKFDRDIVNDLFNAEFWKMQEFEDVKMPLNDDTTVDLSNAFSFALTNKNFAKLSLYKEGLR